MTADELKMAYEVFKQVAQDSKPEHDKYNNSMFAHNYADSEYMLKFMSWIKQTYPDIWESWRALQDLEHSVAKESITIGGFK